MSETITPNTGDLKIIKVSKKNCTTKDGRSFVAWETADKHGRKVSVHFCQGTPVPDATTYIALKNAWMDKRYTFPLLRVKEYAQVAEVAEIRPEDELPF